MKSHPASTIHLLPLCTLLFSLFAVSCSSEQTELGIDLQDPYTIYHGKRDTAFLSACTIVDDSLSTVGYSSGVFGNARYDGLGSVEAVLYSQISIANTTGIALSDEVTIDSVVMTLVIDTLYPARPEGDSLTLHVMMRQLAESIQADSNYRASASIAESSTVFFDGDVVYHYGDDSIRMMLDESIYPVLRQTCSLEDFIERTKGFSLRLADNAQCLVTVNLAATATRITLFYHTPSSQDLKYNFVTNSSAIQFMHYSHDYSGTPLQPLANGSTSIEGSQRLYLLPLGGTKVLLNLQDFLDTFRIQHPTATIHYAELLLPTSSDADTSRAVRITALKRTASGSSAYVTDANVLTNPYTYNGFDGYYHRDKGYYRLRVTQHLQELLREGQDYGTELIVDARRSTAFPAVLNGTSESNPIRIDFIYTE